MATTMATATTIATRKATWTARIGLLALAAAGCGSPKAVGPGPARARAAAAAATPASGTAAPGGPAAATAPPAPDDVTLLDAGAEPRAVLRYQLPADGRWAYDAVARTRVATGTLPATELPDLVMDGGAAVVGAAGGGDLQVELTASHLAMRSGTRAMVPMERMNPHLAGWSVTVRAAMSPAGRLSHVEILPSGGPEDADLSGLSHALHELIVELPDQPVGPGARWRAHVHVTAPNGVQVDQTTDVRLLEVHGHVARLALELHQTAPPQTVHLRGPALAGKTVEEKRHTGAGTATIDLDLTRLVNPVTLDLHVVIEATSGGAAPMTTRLDTGLEVHPR